MCVRKFGFKVMMACLIVAIPTGATAVPPRQQSPANSSAVVPGKPSEPVITNVLQLCYLREAEIVQYNKAITQRSAALVAELDAARRPALLAAVEAARRGLIEVEISWQRMSCATILYNNPFAANGKFPAGR